MTPNPQELHHLREQDEMTTSDNQRPSDDLATKQSVFDMPSADAPGPGYRIGTERDAASAAAREAMFANIQKEMARQPGKEVEEDWLLVERPRRSKKLSIATGVILSVFVAMGVITFLDSRKGAPKLTANSTTGLTTADGQSASNGGLAAQLVGGAEDKRAQARLKGAIVAARIAVGESGTYAGANAERLKQDEPGTQWVDGVAPSTSPDVVSVAATDVSWTGTALSNSGTCFVLIDDATGSHFGSLSVRVGATGCSAATIATQLPSNLGNSWETASTS
jgi:hypothetical protein